MAWANDLAQVAGIPASAAPLAVAHNRESAHDALWEP